ncbi:MAG: flagellar brake protein [Butyrivibrio sp.]|nr:flagellar brake protein [Butyrivibrio sp.]
MFDNLISEGDKIDFRDILTEEQVKDGVAPNVYVSQVLDFTENGNIMAAMPIKQRNLVPLSKGQQYEVFFYTHKGLYQSIAVIVDRFKSGNIYSMEISLTSELRKHQRRQYYRLEKSIAVKYAQITEEEYEAFLREHTAPKRLQTAADFCDGTSLDISGGGLRFIGGRKIEKARKLVVQFDIVGSGGPIRYCLPAKVIMSFEMPDRISVFEHRIEFAGISRESRETLIKYIFEEERKMRRDAKY